MPTPKKKKATTPKKKKATTKNDVAEEEVKKATESGEDGEYVKVKKEDLQAVLERQERMEKDMELLRSSANKNKLAEAERKAGVGVDPRPRMHLKKLSGKVLHYWFGKDETNALDKNQVIFNGNNPVGEVMKMHVVYLDQDEEGNPVKEIIDYRDFAQATERVHFRVNGKREEDGEIFLKAELEDPTLQAQYGEFEINLKHVNP